MLIFFAFQSFHLLPADSPRRRLCWRSVTWGRRETCSPSFAPLCVWMKETCGVKISAHLIGVMRIRERYVGSMESPLLSRSFSACWAPTCKEVSSQWVYARHSGWVTDWLIDHKFENTVKQEYNHFSFVRGCLAYSYIWMINPAVPLFAMNIICFLKENAPFYS